MKTVILHTHKRTKSNSFSDARFLTPTVVPSVGLFIKLTTKSTKPKLSCHHELFKYLIVLQIVN
jgi:hypothetical protein